jgi:hypothetical protein
MAIETSTYLEYDSTEHFYYLTESGAETLADIEIGIWGNASKRLKRMGRLLHQAYTNSAYNGKRKYTKHSELIDYKVFKNENNEVTAIQNALVTFADLAEYQDLDLMLNAGEVSTLPNSIIAYLRNAQIYFQGEITGYVPEDEYYNGY